MTKEMTLEEKRAEVESRLERIFAIEEFDDNHKRRIYLGDMPDMEKYLARKEKVDQDRSAGHFLPCLLPCYKEPLLSRDQEQHQFRKYNLLKHLAKERLAEDQIRYAYCYIQRAIELGNTLAESNFRLAAAVIRNKVGLQDEEKLSDSYMDVMKAVDYFDWTRGTKFSTYTTWVIKRTLFRNWEVERRERERGCLVDTESMADSVVAGNTGYEEERQHEINKRTVAHLLNYCGTGSEQDNLERRQFILTHRFGLGGSEEYTLEQIGDILGISKERVRQIESQSLDNILEHLQTSKKHRRKVA